MTDWASMIFTTDFFVAACGGLGFGIVYYGGLWWTVQRVGEVARPGLLFAASFIVRTTVTLAGLLWLTELRGELILAFMLTFVLTRLLLTQRWGPAGGRTRAQSTGET